MTSTKTALEIWHHKHATHVFEPFVNVIPLAFKCLIIASAWRPMSIDTTHDRIKMHWFRVTSQKNPLICCIEKNVWSLLARIM